MPPKSQRPPVARSPNANSNNEESIYIIAADGLQQGPRIKTFNVAPAGPNPAKTMQPKPRTHADSSQIQNIMNPVLGPRDAQIRSGLKPMDHSRSNKAAVKELSQLNALRKAASSQEIRDPPRSRSTSAPTRRPAPSLQHQTSDNGRNFVQENRMGAAAPLRPPRTESKVDDGGKYLNKKDYGRVPHYLIERKIELAEQYEEQQRRREAALIPPGMRLMPEDERLETLAILDRNKAEVEKALQGLPIIIETPSAIRRKDDLERRLREIEDAYKIFSRPKVLVQI